MEHISPLVSKAAAFATANKEMLRAVPFALGAYCIVRFVATVLSGIYSKFLRPGKNIKKCYGSWAVVTGATDGIGLAMCYEFARKGMNVLLISRSRQKLDDCAASIKKKYPETELSTLVVDFTFFNEKLRQEVADAIKDLDVGVLVNNVGISYPYTKYFHELDTDVIQQLLTLNVWSTTFMTKIVLPGMLARKRGAIVNIGSASGVATAPLLSQYGAAKSYILMFSKAMNVELAGKGIHVQCQVPLYVTTKLAKIRNASLFVCTPEVYARAAVACIGYEVDVSPYWSHALQMFVIKSLPDFIMTKLTMLSHLSIRAAGLKKDKRISEAALAAESPKKTK